ncbi:unnamed protein product [Owenia fusiformis]|uniref:Uncharacterized protein n=1 Tax=Owenia fusiformis TaxID=6347 RepID=A0A8J1XW68_OWEFU|nr:unnamed protein product [Owenia fusiformis]
MSAVQMLFVYAIGLFYAFFVSLRMIWLMVTKGGKVFHKKTRSLPTFISDSSYGVHRYLKTKDIKLHYVASGEEDKPLMVMLHGFPEFWYSWRHQIKEFNKDYRVVAVDTRGCGHTDKPTEIKDYNLAKLIEDIRELIEGLGYKSCVLVGHDWGGVITWGLTQKYPDLVDKAIVMNCPHPGVFQKYMRTHLKQFLKSWYMFFFSLPWFPEWVFLSGDLKMIENTFRGKTMGAKRAGSFSDDDIEAFKYMYSQPGAVTCAMNYIRAGLKGGMGSKADRPRGPIETPVLLLWGTEDGALESEMAELSGKYCTAFTLKWIGGASHWVQQDQPEEVNNQMRRFLQA